MARDVLPIFSDKPQEVAEALSEPFVNHRSFSVLSADPDFGKRDIAVLIGMITAYISSPPPAGEGVNGVELALTLDNNSLFERPVLGEILMKGYRDSLRVPHGIADSLLEKGKVTAEDLEDLEFKAADMTHAAGLLNVASVAVLGTPDDYTSALIVPAKVVREITIANRERMMRSIVLDEEVPRPDDISPSDHERYMHMLMTQSPSWRHFGMFASAGFLPRADVMQGVVEASASNQPDIIK